MLRRSAGAWAVCALLATGAVRADDKQPAAAGKDDDTVRAEDVTTGKVTLDGRDYEVRPATPDYAGDTGLFHLPTAYTLGRGKFSVGAYRDNLDRDPKDIDISILGGSVAYGITSRLEVFGGFGFQNRVDADALFQPGFVNDYPLVASPWQTGVGDVALGGKYKFLDDFRGAPVALAARAYVKLPTADENKGLGTGKASFGGDLIVSKSLGHVVDVHGSVGYEINGDPTDVDIGNAFKWGVGLNTPTFKRVQLQAEVTGAVYGDADVDQTNPVDVIIGPVVWFGPGIFVRAALSWNANFHDRGLGSSFRSYSDYQISLGYHPGTPGRAIAVAAPPPPPPPANRNPTVSCAVDRSQVLPGEQIGARASGSDPDGDNLSYEWSTTGGRVTGSGAAVSIDTAGVAAPATVTITVRASDGRGGSATGSCSARVQAPERRPEVVRCDSGGFPRNLSRLNNVDKACLDDVASRLRQDPRSRVVVIGHADSQERHPEVVARTRAEAVKTYLVSERGVDESRVSVRSAGASGLLDTGASAQAHARNRRVEVVFVPEGAQAPEDDD